MNENRSNRTTIRRAPQRGSYEQSTVHAILDAAFLAHVGFCVDQQPFVIPTLYGRKEDTLYLHGSAASRMMRSLEKGIPACVTVTHVDGLVLARSAFHHSMNYRSVTSFGVATKVESEDEKNYGLRVISDHLIYGRWDAVRPPNAKELKATTVLRFVIEEASAKTRDGGPVDDEEDYSLPIWAGVLPLQTVAGDPITDHRLPEGVQTPPHVVHYRTGIQNR